MEMSVMEAGRLQRWRMFRKWWFYYRYLTTTTTTATLVMMVVVVVVVVGWNALLLPSTDLLHLRDDSSGVETATTTTAIGGDGGGRYVRALKMDWRRRYRQPWPNKNDKNANKRTRKRKKTNYNSHKTQEEEEEQEYENEIKKYQSSTNNSNSNSFNSSVLRCEGYRVGFASEGSLPPVALASYPGSGNTWLRELVEEAAGVFTGSTYDDQHLYVTGLAGELEPWTAGTTLTQKTHSSSPSVTAAFRGRAAVLLVRNPYRALLAYHNYLFGGHFGYAPVSNYRSKDWGAFVHMQARAWIDMAINWTELTKEEEEEEDRRREEEEEEEKDRRREEKEEEKDRRREEKEEEEEDRRREEEEEEEDQIKKGKKEEKEDEKKKQFKEGGQKEVGRRVAVVYYEEILQDPLTSLSRVLDVLPLPPVSYGRMECLKKHLSSKRRFKRKQEYLPQHLDIFSPADRDKVDRAIRYVDHHLRHLHLPPLPLHLYEYYNNTLPRTQKTLWVSCVEGETLAACDARVDQLNAAWRRRKRKTREGKSEQSPSSLLEDGEEEEEEEEDPLERFAGTKVGRFLTEGFTSFMKQFRGDPLQQATQ